MLPVYQSLLSQTHLRAAQRAGSRVIGSVGLALSVLREPVDELPVEHKPSDTI